MRAKMILCLKTLNANGIGNIIGVGEQDISAGPYPREVRSTLAVVFMPSPEDPGSHRWHIVLRDGHGRVVWEPGPGSRYDIAIAAADRVRMVAVPETAFLPAPGEYEWVLYIDETRVDEWPFFCPIEKPATI